MPRPKFLLDADMPRSSAAASLNTLWKLKSKFILVHYLLLL